MPWKIKKNSEGQYCIHKEGADGEPTGEPLHCHPTEEAAKQQLAALYANEPTAKAVKFVEGSDDVVEGPGIPYGGCFNGRDLDAQFFSAKTDFAFDWFKERPLLYHHGLNDDAGITVVGRVKSWQPKDEIGVWTQAQLDVSNKYFNGIKELVKQGKLFFSSGAMAHLVKVDNKSGEITRWPWVELSLTPTPANLLATVDFATADKHYKSAGLDLPTEVQPEEEPAVKTPNLADLLDLILESDDLMGALDATSLETHTEATKSLAAVLLQRTKDLQQRRIKEGRVISTPNRKRLSDCLSAMQAACEQLQVLLDSTEPQPAKAASVWRQLMARNIDSFASQFTQGEQPC
jgi:hypothetical protein